MDEYNLLIDGALVAADARAGVIDPATGQVFAHYPLATVAQMNQAIAAANRAFPAWSRQSLAERAACLNRLADALEQDADGFARLLTREQGKPLNQAMFEIMGSVGTLRAFAGMRLEPRTLRKTVTSEVIEIRAPLGVVAAITPWNFPLILLMNKLGPALLAGNTMVAKPAPTTPLTTLRFGVLAAAILPAGVLNVISDQNDLGTHLATHPDVAKIAFTGSTATGRKVMASAAHGIKRVTLELGGNDAAIVLDDMDADVAAQRVYDGAMVNAGQVCVAIKRVYVPQSMYEDFCGAIARIAQSAIVDDGDKQGTQIGPVQNKAQFDKLSDLLVETARDGRVIAGGMPLDRAGYFIPPTIVRDIADDARLVRDEQFGPVLPVMSYTTVEEAIARANDSDFGLAATVWGRDGARAAAIAQELQAGTVWVNHHLGLDPGIPFRGAKQSGFGGELGQEGLHEYTQARIVNSVALEPA